MRTLIVTACFFSLHLLSTADVPRELRVGIAGHAFEHLGGIGDQADAAIASGMTIIYPAGFGQMAGYDGLAKPEELKKAHEKFIAYNRRAKTNGIQLAIAYVCATSIVKLESFDRNWSDTFRAKFSTPLAQWLQQDRDGKPLPSWYGGDYLPACMNNPDWRIYEKNAVRLQLEAGHDGIFFDNPTVHPQGCYCEHCMKKFAKFLRDEGQKVELPKTNTVAFLRQLAVKQPKDFMRFRCTTARDFMAEMRSYARTLKGDALITCNNSLNSPGVFFSQCRDYGYNIYEMSKTEDWITVEDMVSQPRVVNGNPVEYGHVYELLQSISHGKPLVTCTIADGDYHTAPNLVRLAMAEAAAHRASYLAWPTWPEDQRTRMISTIRPQADFLRRNATLLNDVQPRADVLLFLPFRKWVDATNSWALDAAASLVRSNIQFEAVCEDDFVHRLSSNSAKKSVLLLESSADLNPREKEALEKFKKKNGRIIFGDKGNWFSEIQSTLTQPSILLDAPPTVRATVLDQKNKTIVHLLNLNIQRLSSFEDKVTPASNLRIKVRVPFAKVHSVEMLSADVGASQQLQFTSRREKGESWVEITIPELKISAMVVLK